MDSSIECVEEMDDADKQLVKSVKPLLCEIRVSFSESSVRKKVIHSLLDRPGAGDKADICTAASLLGLDISNISSSQKKQLQGDLFDLPEIVNSFEDTPETWIKNVEIVDYH